jgi:hypothetical protein
MVLTSRKSIEELSLYAGDAEAEAEESGNKSAAIGCKSAECSLFSQISGDYSVAKCDWRTSERIIWLLFKHGLSSVFGPSALCF